MFTPTQHAAFEQCLTTAPPIYSDEWTQRVLKMFYSLYEDGILLLPESLGRLLIQANIENTPFATCILDIM